MATIKITQVRSQIASTAKQRGVLRSLKLGKIGSCTEREDTKIVKGQVAAISHLIKVEKVN